MTQPGKAVPIKFYDFKPDIWEGLEPPPSKKADNQKAKIDFVETDVAPRQSSSVQKKQPPKGPSVQAQSQAKPNKPKQPRAIPDEGEWRPDLDEFLVIDSELHKPNYDKLKQDFGEVNNKKQLKNSKGSDPFSSKLIGPKSYIKKPVTKNDAKVQDNQSKFESQVFSNQDKPTSKKASNTGFLKGKAPIGADQLLQAVTKQSQKKDALNAANPNVRIQEVDENFDNAIMEKLGLGISDKSSMAFQKRKELKESKAKAIKDKDIEEMLHNRVDLPKYKQELTGKKKIQDDKMKSLKPIGLSGLARLTDPKSFYGNRKDRKVQAALMGLAGVDIGKFGMEEEQLPKAEDVVEEKVSDRYIDNDVNSDIDDEYLVDDVEEDFGDEFEETEEDYKKPETEPIDEDLEDQKKPETEPIDEDLEEKVSISDIGNLSENFDQGLDKDLVDQIWNDTVSDNKKASPSIISNYNTIQKSIGKTNKANLAKNTSKPQSKSKLQSNEIRSYNKQVTKPKKQELEDLEKRRKEILAKEVMFDSMKLDKTTKDSTLPVPPIKPIENSYQQKSDFDQNNTIPHRKIQNGMSRISDIKNRILGVNVQEAIEYGENMQKLRSKFPDYDNNNSNSSNLLAGNSTFKSNLINPISGNFITTDTKDSDLFKSYPRKDFLGADGDTEVNTGNYDKAVANLVVKKDKTRNSDLKENVDKIAKFTSKFVDDEFAEKEKRRLKFERMAEGDFSDGVLGNRYEEKFEGVGDADYKHPWVRFGGI